MRHELVRGEAPVFHPAGQVCSHAAFRPDIRHGFIRSPDHNIAHALLEFPIVAGPGIPGRQLVPDPFLDFAQGAFGVLADHSANHVLENLMKSLRRVIDLLAQRGRANLIGAQAVVEVVAKSSGANLSGEVPIGSRDELARKLPQGRIADGGKAAGLENAQQLHSES